MAIKISGRVKPISEPQPAMHCWKKAQAIFCELLKHKEAIGLLATIGICDREWLRLYKLSEEMNDLKLKAELKLVQKFGISVSDLFYVELAVDLKEAEVLLKKLGGVAGGLDV